MGEVVTQPVTWEKWPPGKPVFETQDDLFECLKELVEAGHRGQVRAIPVSDEETRWDLELGIGDVAVPVVIGQVVVRLGDAVEAMSPEQYTERYEAKKGKKKS